MRFVMLGLAVLTGTTSSWAQDTVPANFQTSQLVAWCIVPFDAAQRGPEARATMVKELGLRRIAYDWRPQHVGSFEEEIRQYQHHGIEFFAFWSWHDSMEPLIKQYKIRPQIWMTLRSPEAPTQQQRVATAAQGLLEMVDKTRQLGLKLGLYNHGGWGGEPNNLVAVCKFLRENHDANHVGIVYNFHHAHHESTNFREWLEMMKPFLLCLNLNGMVEAAQLNAGNKITSIGSGDYEREMISAIIQQSYTGPIGILDHRNEMDAKDSLQQNLDGLGAVMSELADRGKQSD